MKKNTTAPSGFAELGIASQILKALQKNKIHTPTPIQNQSIPIALEGKDILGIAQTGTGKTLAFGIPVLQRLDRFPGISLILVPTRELAGQVAETMQRYGRVLKLKSTTLIGGVAIRPQVKELSANPRIIIATPGRLIDLIEQKKLKLDQVQSLILDEADRMLDMGFAPQLRSILKLVPKKRQTLLFSATMSRQILDLASKIMDLPIRIEIAPAGSSVKAIEQEIFIIRPEAKFSLLERLLAEYPSRVLVFVRTKRGASKVTKTLKMLGHRPAEIHSDRSQGQRRAALAGFKSGKYKILIATDIAARGIDVEDVAAVINFDLPDNSEDYVHRIGRTGRAGKRGKAISFATPDQRREVNNIERLIRKKIKVSTTPEETKATSKKPVKKKPARKKPNNKARNQQKGPKKFRQDKKTKRTKTKGKPKSQRTKSNKAKKTNQPQKNRPMKRIERQKNIP